MEGTVTNIEYSDNPVSLVPHNTQAQIKAVTLRLPVPSSSWAKADGIATAKSRSKSNDTPIADSKLSHHDVRVEIKAIIGNGTFGIVYRASCFLFRNFAMKVCVGKEQRLKREWEALKRCSNTRAPVGGSQSIVDVSKRAMSATATTTVGSGSTPDIYFSAFSKENTSLMIVGMELCLPLTLHDFLVYDAPLPLCAIDLAYQVVKSVADVHRAGCVHRDIKLHNFVFDPKGRLRLVDFGLAFTDLNPPAGDLVAGTYAFMSPEMAYNVLSPKEDRLSVGVPADIWSVGAVLFCIFTRDDMYPVSYEDVGLTPSSPESQRKSQAERNRSLLVRVSKGRYKWPDDEATLNIPPNIRHLIEGLLQLDLAKRTPLDEVLNDASLWGRSLAASSKGAASMVDAHKDLQSFLGVGQIGMDKDGLLAVEKSTVKKSPHGSRVSRTPMRVSSSSHAVPSVTAQMSVAATTTTAATQLPPPPSPRISTEIGSPIIGSASKKAVTRNLLNDDELLSASPSPRGRVSSHKVITISDSPMKPARVDPTNYKGLRLGRKEASLIAKDQEMVRESIAKEEATQFLELSQLFDAQSHNFSHPHKFKRYDKPVDSSYNSGAMCDNCGIFVAPRGRAKTMIFFHCCCGSDLCVSCHEAHERRYTCQGCGHMSQNHQAFCRHAKSCKKLKPSSPSASRTPQTSRVSGGRRSRSVIEISSDISSHQREVITEETTIAELVPQALLPRGGTTPASSLTARGSRERSRSLNLAGGSTSPPQVMSVDELLLNPPTPIELNEVHVGEGQAQWQPYARLKQRTNESISKQPTPQERNQLTNGDWVRFFYYYPDEENPGAFVYSIQPGRTGAIFLSATAVLHSAVEAVVEARLFVVDSVDISDPQGDEKRVISFNEAKSSYPDLVQIILAALKRNSTLVKLKRAVGVMSVCQSQSRPIALVGCPFVYVRWVRVDPSNDITAFCLSNGFVQVFIGTEFEIRWTDLDRKFLLRANGTMELLADDEFKVIPGLVELIYSPLEVNEP